MTHHEETLKEAVTKKAKKVKESVTPVKVKAKSKSVKKTKDHDMDNNDLTKKIVTGVIITGAVGCITAALIAASRKPKGFKEKCEDYTEKCKSLISDMSEQVQDKASGAVDYVKDEFEDTSVQKGLIVGAALGGLLASGAALLYNWHSNKDQSFDWKKLAANVIHSIQDKTENVKEGIGHVTEQVAEHAEHARDEVKNKTGEFIDLAQAGLNFIKTFKS
ncbi:MAG: hypothetical protein LLF94_03570 [Chlamydiales bacterium]|nr:hypothetical protein [Chlamydiales bacterium]